MTIQSTELSRKRAAFGIALLIIGSMISPAFAGKVKADYEFGRKKDVGLAVISITLSGVESLGNGHFLMLRYRPVGSDTGPMTASNLAMDTGLFKATPSDFPDVQGAVLAYELKDGDYEIIEYSYRPSGMEEFKITLYKDDPKLTFHVQAGAVTYIGNFNMTLSKEKTLMYRKFEVLGEGPADQSSRDLPIFVSRFKKITAEKIFISVMGLEKPEPVKPYVP